jgi:hypothetical protein
LAVGQPRERRLRVRSGRWRGGRKRTSTKSVLGGIATLRLSPRADRFAASLCTQPCFMSKGGGNGSRFPCLVCMCAVGGDGPKPEWRASARIAPRLYLCPLPRLLAISPLAGARRHRPADRRPLRVEGRVGGTGRIMTGLS